MTEIVDIIAREIEVAPDVRYRAWTFGGTVPGPVLHVREGDRVDFTMKNRSAEVVAITAPEVAGSPYLERLAALDLQRDLAGRVDAVLERHDLLVTAISLAPAPPLDATGAASRWPLQSTAFNVSGHPAISVPLGLSRDGLPLAVQIVGRRFDEALVLRAARVLERASRWLDIPLPE